MQGLRRQNAQWDANTLYVIIGVVKSIKRMSEMLSVTPYLLSEKFDSPGKIGKSTFLHEIVVFAKIVVFTGYMQCGNLSFHIPSIKTKFEHPVAIVTY